MQIALVIPEFPANVRSDTYAIDYGRILGAEWMARSAGWNQPEAYVVLDTDPEFDGHVALLSEAGRLRPEFGMRVLNATNDREIDQLVDEARGIVDAASDQAWV